MRIWLAVGALALGMAAAGCGGGEGEWKLDLELVQRTVANGIEDQVGVRPARVECIQDGDTTGSCVVVYPDSTRDFVSVTCSAESGDCVWRVTR